MDVQSEVVNDVEELNWKGYYHNCIYIAAPLSAEPGGRSIGDESAIRPFLSAAI